MYQKVGKTTRFWIRSPARGRHSRCSGPARPGNRTRGLPPGGGRRWGRGLRHRLSRGQSRPSGRCAGGYDRRFSQPGHRYARRRVPDGERPPVYNDGRRSYGEKGFVTVKLQELLDAGETYDLVIAIGPLPMMRAGGRRDQTLWDQDSGVHEPDHDRRNGDVWGRRLTVGGETKFACVDGPESTRIRSTGTRR